MMGSEKHGNNNNSDTSSDQETDNSSKEGFGRSYECTYCKRGFTNAQALGGHMNIHRKDKAKAKKHNTASTKPSKDHHLVVSSKSFNVFPNEEARNLGSLFGFSTHNPGYQFMPLNPNFHPLRDEHLRVNLNLGIGSSMESSNIIESANVRHEDWLETEVDLELRLGHYP